MKSPSVQPTTSPKTYADCSTQTTQKDPDNFLRNFDSLTLVSDCDIQTDPCVLEPITSAALLPCREGNDESDEDASSNDHEMELQRRLCPTRPEDFETLQSELLYWRHSEEQKIAASATSEEHKKELTKVLLNKEACLLRKIDSLRNSASEKWRKENAERSMERFAQPKRWELGKGSFIGIDTPESCRAREMKGMYDELMQKVEDNHIRISLLQRIKALVETIDHCGLAKDVRTLVDRELETLNRGRLGNELMEGLRKRLCNQFMKLISKMNSGSDVVGHPVKPKFRIHNPGQIRLRRTEN